MPTIPKYNVGDVVYFRESAALGFIEPVSVSGIHLGPSNVWLYSVNVRNSPPGPGMFMDRRKPVGITVLFYTEDELVSVCDAYLLAEANAKITYERIQAQRMVVCPNNPTGTG